MPKLNVGRSGGRQFGRTAAMQAAATAPVADRFSTCEHPDQYDGLPSACMCTCSSCWGPNMSCVCTQCDHSGH